eukprot:5006580-Prymnesium_polylepis.1
MGRGADDAPRPIEAYTVLTGGSERELNLLTPLKALVVPGKALWRPEQLWTFTSGHPSHAVTPRRTHS